MTEETDSPGEVENPRLVVRFGGGEDVDVSGLLESVRDELTRSPARLELAEELLARRERLEECAPADPANPRLLLSDPQSALRDTIPDIEPPDVTAAGRELIDQLIAVPPGARSRRAQVHTARGARRGASPDVANDAASRPDGYSIIFSDVRGNVVRVEAGRYGLRHYRTRVINGIDGDRTHASTRQLRVHHGPCAVSVRRFPDQRPRRACRSSRCAEVTGYEFR